MCVQEYIGTPPESIVSWIMQNAPAKFTAFYNGSDKMYELPVSSLNLPAGIYSISYAGDDAHALTGFNDIERTLVVS